MTIGQGDSSQSHQPRLQWSYNAVMRQKTVPVVLEAAQKRYREKMKRFAKRLYEPKKGGEVG